MIETLGEWYDAAEKTQKKCPDQFYHFLLMKNGSVSSVSDTCGHIRAVRD